MSTRDHVARRQQLTELLGPVVQARGYDLEDVSVAVAGRRSVIRVIVDSDDGVDLDAVADISRVASDVLDVDSASFPGPFVLEVSSPGVDRPLTEQRHWRRATGRLVRTSSDGVAIRGRVASVDSSTVSFEVGDAVVEFALSALGPGRVEVEFARAGHTVDLADDGAQDDDEQHEGGITESYMNEGGANTVARDDTAHDGTALSGQREV